MNTNTNIKVGDNVKIDVHYGMNVNNNIGVCVAISLGDVIVDFGIHGRVRVPAAYVEEVRAA